LPGGILPGRGQVFFLLTIPSLLTLFSLFIHEDQEQRKTGGHWRRMRSAKTWFFTAGEGIFGGVSSGTVKGLAGLLSGTAGGILPARFASSGHRRS